MNSLRILAAVLIAAAIAPLAAAADFGVRAGRYNEAGTDFVGAELVFDAGALKINPNIEYSLEDDVTAGSANVDITVDVTSIGRLKPYVGAGLGMSYAEFNGSSNTEILGNLIGGVALELEFLKPYAQVKYFRLLGNDDNVADGDNDELALTVGLRF